MQSNPAPAPSKQQQFKQKHALKEEAKQMLLKECYKMAMNKYLRLIEQGAEGFSQREWAVVHLNTAISMQCLGRPQEALEKVNASIRIDPLYEKPYFRRLQLLDELGQYQAVFHDSIVPGFITNPEIEQLRREIKQKYTSSAALATVQSKLQDPAFVEVLGGSQKLTAFVTEMHRSIFERIGRYLLEEFDVEALRNHETEEVEKMGKMGGDFGEYYRFLRQGLTEDQQQSQKWTGDFLACMYKLIISLKADYGVYQKFLFLPFWSAYHQVQSPSLQALYARLLTDNNSKDSNQVPCDLLLLHNPLSILEFRTCLLLLETAVQQPRHANIPNLFKFLQNNHQALAQFRHRPYYEQQEDESYLLYSQQQKSALLRFYNHYICGVMDARMAGVESLGEFSILSILGNEILNLYFLLYKQPPNMEEIGIKQLHLTAQVLITMAYIMRNKQKQQKMVGLLLAHLLKLLRMSMKLLNLCVAVQCIHSLIGARDQSYRDYGQGLIAFLVECNSAIQNNSQLWAQISSGSPQCNMDTLLGYLMSYMVVSYLKPDYVSKLTPGTPQVDTTLARLTQLCHVTSIHKLFKSLNPPAYMEAVKIYLKVLAILSMSSLTLNLAILDHTGALAAIYCDLFIGAPDGQAQFIDSVQTVNTSIKLLYTLVIDLMAEQNEQHAEKMGVDPEEVAKAKQLQAQGDVKKIVGKANKAKGQFVQAMVGGDSKWDEVIVRLMDGVLLLRKNEPQEAALEEEKLLVSIVCRLAETQPNKFYNSRLIQFMLDCHSRPEKHNPDSQPSKTAYKVSRFVSLIAKKCNPNLFSYSQLQSIANCLISLVQHAKHQLHTFEALLSLINLSSRSITVPITIVSEGMLEENQYIVHACLELLNNMLVNLEQEADLEVRTKSQEKWQKELAKIEQLVLKYYQHYRQMLLEGCGKLDTTTIGNVNDYSHPFKIYCTLLSVLMVMQTEHANKHKHTDYKHTVVELLDWKQADLLLKHIDSLHGDISMTLFKIALMHADRKSLPRGWHTGYEAVLSRMKAQQPDKWARLQKYST